MALMPQRTAARRTLGELRPTLIAYGFLAPFALAFIVFVILPLGYAFYLSLFRETIMGGRRFVGVANYARIANDGNFWESCGTVLKYGVIYIPIMTTLALLIALVFDGRRLWGKTFFLASIFTTYAVPSVLGAMIWGYLYGPVFGPFGQIATAAGLPRPNFFAPGAVLFSLINISVWQYTGYVMIVFFAALKSIPPELEEAATIDGARSWQYALRVKVPLIRPTILLSLLLTTIGVSQLFNEPNLLKSAARDVINNHYTPNIYAYWLAFSAQDYGYSAAVSFVLAAIVFAIALLFVRAMQRLRAQGT